jgi:hypothetical protein
MYTDAEAFDERLIVQSHRGFYSGWAAELTSAFRSKIGNRLGEVILTKSCPERANYFMDAGGRLLAAFRLAVYALLRVDGLLHFLVAGVFALW